MAHVPFTAQKNLACMAHALASGKVASATHQHPPFGFQVWHEWPGPLSRCRYICRRNLTMDSPAVASPDSSSPAKGRAAPTATAENTKNSMIAGMAKFLVAAMISSFSPRFLPSLVRFLSPLSQLELYNASVCFDALLIAAPINHLYTAENTRIWSAEKLLARYVGDLARSFELYSSRTPSRRYLNIKILGIFSDSDCTVDLCPG